MSSKPLVSSIIIFLDAERFIEEAIESVFAQTYDNWELLLVDDGSADSSTQIALRYAEQHPGKVRYLEHPGHRNRGTGASRNLGIEHAKGEYIAFLDADDVWLEDKLERQVAVLGSHPEAGMLYGPIEYWYSWTGNPEDVRRDFVPELGFPTNTLFEPPTLLTLLHPLGSAPQPHLSNLLLRRGAVERTGGFEEAFGRMYEDQAFYAKVYLKEPVFVASECWSRYRQHPDSCCAVMARMGQHLCARQFFLDWLEEYLLEQGVEDAKIWKLLQEDRIVVQVRAHAQDREWKQALRSLLVLARYHPRAFARAYRKLTLRTQARRWLSW
jgi:glycosyltransferase involved in cell wall biosynthesis